MAEYPGQTSSDQIQTTADHSGPKADQTEPKSGQNEAKLHPTDPIKHQLSKIAVDQDAVLQIAHDAAAACPGMI